jgi:hypothetical protein
MTQQDQDLVQRFLAATNHLGAREAAQLLGKSHETVARWRRKAPQRLTANTRRAIERTLAGDELARSKAAAGQAELLFFVSNHHVESCGTPPKINGDTPNSYHSYFENEFGEQAIFIYDHEAAKGVLRMGDADWQGEYPVEDGFSPVANNMNESFWLVVCWAAATGEQFMEVMKKRDERASRYANEVQRQVRKQLKDRVTTK